jgi:hypothetical protein
MRYEKPQVHEIGEADELIQVIFTGQPLDFEWSTGWWGYIDWWV